MFKTNALCYKRTFGRLCGLEALNHGSELRILWDTFRSQIAEFWFPYDRRIANDRRRSQKIEHGSIFCDRLRSRSQDRRRSQTIAEVCFHMIADDRRTFCDLRSSAIIWKPALSVVHEMTVPHRSSGRVNLTSDPSSVSCAVISCC